MSFDIDRKEFDEAVKEQNWKWLWSVIVWAQNKGPRRQKEKPSSLCINGGLVEVETVSAAEAGDDLSMVTFQNMNGGLSPYEAEELRDWLTNFLDWHYGKKK